MVLTVDIGNTLIKLGFFEDDLLKNIYRIKTDAKLSSDEFANKINDLIKNNKDNIELEGAIISSVVPLLTDIIEEAIYKLFKIKPLILNNKIKTKLRLKIDHPQELGGDLLAGAIGALIKFETPLVVADLGTATKMYIIDKDNNYIGGMISAGMRVSLEALVNQTSLLLKTPLEKPNFIISKNTKDSIQSGIVYGQSFMIEEFANRMEEELGYRLNRILTGGFSKIIKDTLPNFTYEENLTLIGLNHIYKINRK